MAGALHLAIVVKATFRLVPDRAMALVAPDAIAASDLAPYRPRADVTLRGNRTAPVRLALWRGAGGLIDARITAAAPHSERALNRSVPELPANFDWRFFQVAPPEQQTDFLEGDEWVGLEGASSELPRIQSRLPGAQGCARIYSPPLPAGSDIGLYADTLSIDLDSLCASVVWRGSLAAPDGLDLRQIHAYAGVAIGAARPQFPAEHRTTSGLAETATLDDSASLAARIRAALAVPFLPGSGAAPPPAAHTSPPPGFGATVGLDDAASIAAQIRAALPQPPAPPPPPAPLAPPAPAPNAPARMAETVGIGDGDLAAQIRAAMPFTPSSEPSVAPATPAPSSSREEPEPRARKKGSYLDGTASLDEAAALAAQIRAALANPFVAESDAAKAALASDTRIRPPRLVKAPAAALAAGGPDDLQGLGSAFLAALERTR